jgi:hypothetical protein
MPLTRYNYRCLNPDCTNKSLQTIKKEESERDEPEFCETCITPMKLMGEVVSGGLTMNFRNSSPEQRKQMLMQRSKKHFVTSGLADKKRDIGERYKKEVISKMKGES